MKTLATAAFTLMAWQGLTAASSAVSPVLSEESLAGHRLFFTQAQRVDATLKVPVVPNVPEGSKPNGSLQELAGSHENRPSPPRQKGSPNDYLVYFTGLVTGMREARVLVNGLPCESVNVEPDAKVDQPVSIDCHGVRDDELRLAVLIITEELLVTDLAGRVHHLTPGEGM